MLRGLGRERRHWFDFPGALALGLGAESYAVDLPGMGERRGEVAPRTIVENARQVVRYLAAHDSISPWGVLGISLGGMVALSLASVWSSGVSHVVVINASSRCSLPHERLRPAALARLASAARGRDARARELRIYELTTNAAADRISAWSARAAELPGDTAPSPRSLVSQLVAAASFRAAPVCQPVLVLSGGADRLVAPACSRALALELGATYCNHPTAGHDLPVEDPQWVITRIRAWLTSNAASLCSKDG